MSNVSSFLNQAASIGQQWGQSIGQSIGHRVQQAASAAAAPEDLRVGNHSVTVKERLAEGGFGVVDLVIENHTQKEFVLKRCNIDREAMYATVKKEILILQKFASPYLVKLIDNDIGQKGSSREALLLMEYYPGGHLLDRLNDRKGNPLPLEVILKIFGQILFGLKPFHEANPPIINRDIKLENVLFGSDGKVRLCDFGSCMESPIPLRNMAEREKAEESIQKETTPMYRAPEMADLYMRDKLTEKTDIWALGCLFYALAFLKHPFQDVGSLGIIAGRYAIPKDSSLPEDCHEFLRRMLCIDPEARPTIAELIAMVVELAAGRPLPAYEYTAEAKQRIEERILANQVRESKAKKKPVAAAPVRKGAPPSANSVAAKRLAAKRGQGVPTEGALHSFNDDENLFESTQTMSLEASAGAARGNSFSVAASSFDPFDSQAEPVPSQSTAAFDPFADSGEDVRGKPSGMEALFGGVQDPPPSKPAVRRPSFDSFPSTAAKGGAAPVAEFSNFDAFNNDNIVEQDFDPFAQPGQSNAARPPNEFDPFAAPASTASVTSSTIAVADSTASILDLDDDIVSPALPSRASFTFAPASTSSARSSFTAQTSPPPMTGFDVFDAPIASVPERRSFSFAQSSSTGFTMTSPPELSTSHSAPASVPAPAADLLDVFSSDLLQPVQAASPAPAAPSVTRSMGGGLGGKVDLLSLYDAPPVAPGPKPVMLSNNSSMSIPYAARAEPRPTMMSGMSAGVGMGMGPRGGPIGGSMALSQGHAPMPMSPSNPSILPMHGGAPRGAPRPMGAGGMNMSGGYGAAPPQMPTMNYGARPIGGYSSSKPADPFDSINVLGRR